MRWFIIIVACAALIFTIMCLVIVTLTDDCCNCEKAVKVEVKIWKK